MLFSLGTEFFLCQKPLRVTAVKLISTLLWGAPGLLRQHGFREEAAEPNPAAGPASGFYLRTAKLG